MLVEVVAPPKMELLVVAGAPKTGPVDGWPAGAPKIEPVDEVVAGAPSTELVDEVAAGAPKTELVDEAVAGAPKTELVDEVVAGAPKTELVVEAGAPPKTELLLLVLTGVPKGVDEAAAVVVGAEPPKIEPPLVPVVGPPPKNELDVRATAVVVAAVVVSAAVEIGVLPPNMDPPEGVPPPKMELPVEGEAVEEPPKTEAEPVVAGVAAVDAVVATGVMDRAPPNIDPPVEEAGEPPKMELEVEAEAPKIDFVEGCSGFFDESVGVPNTDDEGVELVEVVGAGDDSFGVLDPKMPPPPTVVDDPKIEDVFGAPAVED